MWSSHDDSIILAYGYYRDVCKSSRLRVAKRNVRKLIMQKKHGYIIGNLEKFHIVQRKFKSKFKENEVELKKLIHLNFLTP